MAHEAVVIPEKIYFKIGEVCELVGVQAHVLRYWETEFSTLSPQKNKSGQRSYRRRDVEIALRIKQLLYNEMFTIAGARKKLQTELREGSKPKVQPSPAPDAVVEKVPFSSTGAPMLFDVGIETEQLDASATLANEAPHGGQAQFTNPQYSNSQREAMKTLANHVRDLHEMLSNSHVS